MQAWGICKYAQKFRWLSVIAEDLPGARQRVFGQCDANCRTADVLHVAAALEAGANRLLSFDQGQKSVARRMKLKTN
jgi:predicted nucleic acid-binding protein